MELIQIVCMKSICSILFSLARRARPHVDLNKIKINANLLAMTFTKRLIQMIFVVSCVHVLLLLTSVDGFDVHLHRLVVRVHCAFKMRNRIYR